MSVLVCTDLDRTLIYSRRAAGVDPSELRGVETRDGVETSFLTHTAEAALSLLDAIAIWVPTTTRTRTQFARLRLPRAARRPGTDFALCANGGILLVDGVPDLGWAQRVRELVAASAPVAALDAELTRRLRCLPHGVTGGVNDAEGLFRYVVVQRKEVPADWITDLSEWCAARGWRLSVQGRKLYCVPDGLTKAAAAAEVVRRTGSTALVAAGDSLLDADLLATADAGIRPAHGELEDIGWNADHVAVTTARGAPAGEQIASWLLDTARNRASPA